MLGANFFSGETLYAKNINKLNSKKTEVSLEEDLTFRLFNQLNLDLLFDMRLAFGHVLTEWKDTNKIFSLAAINHRSVFNLESTILGFRRAFWFLSKAITSYRRTSIMFVSGLPKYDNFDEFLKFHSAAMPLLGHGYAMHWIPGILTNFYMLISNFWGRAEMIMPKFSKQLKREWFFESLRGVKLFHTFPNFVCFFSTSGIYEVAIKEALLLKIPTIAFVDSDQEVMNITFPIVGNDDSLFGLEVKIYLFRELLVRSLKKFLFSEIEQLIIEQNDLKQVVFQNYFSDRFSEMLGHAKTQFFLRMQKKTRENIRVEDIQNFKKRRLFFFRKWVFNILSKMSLAFLKKNVFNLGVLKIKYKKKAKYKKNLKIFFQYFEDTVTVSTLNLFFFNLFQLDFQGDSQVELKHLNFMDFFFFKLKKTRKNGMFFLENFFIFVKKFFVLQMLFNFIYSSRVLFTKEQLKLFWLFFISYKIFKKQSSNLNVDVSKIFFKLINVLKDFSNFSFYFLQSRLSFFSNLFSGILFKLNRNLILNKLILQGLLQLEKNFAIKKSKHVDINFFQKFINASFAYASFFFSEKFYLKILVQNKKKNLVLNVYKKNRNILKTKQKKNVNFSVVKPNKLLKKNQKKFKRVYSYINAFLKVKNKNADVFLAKYLILWKLYKLKRRNFFALEKQLQKQNFSRLLLLKYNTLFCFFPSLRLFFLRPYKKKMKQNSGVFQRNKRTGRLFKFNEKLQFLSKKKPSRFWFRFRLKSSLLFYIKKKKFNCLAI